MVHGSWFMVHGSWFEVHGSWFMVHGSWFMVHGLRFMVYFWQKRRAIYIILKQARAILALAVGRSRSEGRVKRKWYVSRMMERTYR